MIGVAVLTIGFLFTAGACVLLVLIVERAIARTRPRRVGPAMEDRRKRNAALHRKIDATLTQERTLREELRDVERRQQEG